MVPLDSLLALAGGLVILANEKGLRYVAAAYLLWIAFQGIAPIVRMKLGI